MKSLNKDIPTGLGSLSVCVFKRFRVAHIHTVQPRNMRDYEQKAPFLKKTLSPALSLSL